MSSVPGLLASIVVQANVLSVYCPHRRFVCLFLLLPQGSTARSFYYRTMVYPCTIAASENGHSPIKRGNKGVPKKRAPNHKLQEIRNRSPYVFWTWAFIAGGKPYTLFFIRTTFIRNIRLRFAQKIRTT